MKFSRFPSLLSALLLTLCICLAAPVQAQTSCDLENHTKYEAEGYNIGASLGIAADSGLSEKAAPQGNGKKDEEGKPVTGADSLVAGSEGGFGRDSEEEESVTRSDINTVNITITDEEGQEQTGRRSAEETIAAFTDITTDNAAEHSGALENTTSTGTKRSENWRCKWK